MLWKLVRSFGGGRGVSPGVLWALGAAALAVWWRIRKAVATAEKAQRAHRAAERALDDAREQGRKDEVFRLAEAAGATQEAAEAATAARQAYQAAARTMSADLDAAETPEDYLAAIARRGL